MSLEPALMPLALTLARMALGHRVCERDVEEMFAKVVEEAPLIERMVRLRGLWVRDYLQEKGWHVTNSYSHFQANVQTDSSVYFHRSASVVLYFDYKEPENGARGYWKALEEIAKWEERSLAEVLDDIESRVSAIDLLAALAHHEA